jgi:hypothetical protein
MKDMTVLQFSGQTFDHITLLRGFRIIGGSHYHTQRGTTSLPVTILCMAVSV